MDRTDTGLLKQEFHALTGFLDAIRILKKELELRLEEAREDCVREALDNIITLIDVQGIEYRRQRDD